MEVTAESVLPFTSSGPTFQSIEDFERDQAEIEAQLNAAAASSNSAKNIQNQPSAKKVKKKTDFNALRIEEEAIEELGDTNWIGKLLEYRASKPHLRALEYQETALSLGGVLRFQCAVTLSERPDKFDCGEVTFVKKKDAKQYASKKAIDWLIEEKHMPSDGSVKFPKVPVPQILKAPKSPSISSGNTPKVVSPATPALASYASQIPDLCHRLGFNVPRYRIEQISKEAPLYKAHADFGGDSRIDEEIGEVTGIYGQKNAKEKCAEEVFHFLKDIERQRRENMLLSDVEKKQKNDGDDEEAAGEKRKRRSSSPRPEEKEVEDFLDAVEELVHRSREAEAIEATEEIVGLSGEVDMVRHSQEVQVTY